MPSLFDQPLIFVDLETTGANAERDRITEVGVVTWHGGRVEEWSSLVDPQTAIPPFISRLTGITDAMVAGAPTFAALAPALLERLQGGVFVAHNARFDYGFLKHEFKRVGIDFRARVVCTVKLSRRLFPGEYKHNLDAVAERNGLYVDGDRHRALTDARLIHQFVDKLSRELSMDALAAALDEVSRPPNLPPGIDPEQVESIPDGHGVYLFYGEDDQPLYVGGGDNLKKKVLAHFAAGPKGRAAKLAPLVRRLDWVSTAGELGAQLLEARLLRELQPSHNPRPRRDEAVCAWRFEPNEDGSAQPELVQADRHDFGRDPHLYGLYGSAREAQNTLRKIAEANRLCTVALGLDRAGRKGGTPCFGMQVGRCRGACVGKEPLLTHQARLCAILAKQRLQRWPFKGLVAIREQNEASAACDLHLVDHWRHLGTAANQEALYALLERRADAPFDVDTYKILAKRLSGRHGLEIVPMAYADEAGSDSVD
ncbi:exonuclease domain-containing protein [Chitinimonas koreensis]|uniref:exonuclease domain-containing protein n=1 Tax=Chitinimonas koreensis TaxID=356302 RepID=UPI0003F4CEDC|nr:exonuclease domain-containing protein [Chitinimonas koreensis]